MAPMCVRHTSHAYTCVTGAPKHAVPPQHTEPRCAPVAPLTSATAAARSSPACLTLLASNSTNRLTSPRCSSFSPNRMAPPPAAPLLPPPLPAAATAADVCMGGSCGPCCCQGSAAASTPPPGVPKPCWYDEAVCSLNPAKRGSKPSQSPTSDEVPECGGAGAMPLKKLGWEPCRPASPAPPPLLPVAAAAASALLLLLLLGGAGGAGLVAAV
jgi:hypothetical protein